MNIKIMQTQPTLDILIHKMKACSRFAFVRFGDGEFMLMQGVSKHNHKAHPTLQRELCEAFTINDADWLKAISGWYFPEAGMSAPDVFLRAPGWFQGMSRYYLPWQHHLEPYHFLNADVFSYSACFKTERFIEFMQLIERPFFVTAYPPKILEKLLGVQPNWMLCGKEDYLRIDQWYLPMMTAIFNSNARTIVLSGGPAAKAIAKRLWYQYLPLQIIDLGSVLDACIGPEATATRGWIRQAGKNVWKTVQGRLSLKQTCCDSSPTSTSTSGS
jgi:hypothetical protein